MSNPSNHQRDEVHPIGWIEPPRGSSPSQPSPRSPELHMGSPPGKAERPRIIEVGDAPLDDARIEVSQSVGDSSQAQNGTAPLIIPGVSQDDLNVIEENKVLQDLLEEGPDNHAQLFVPKTKSEILQRHVWVITTSPEEFPNITVAPWEVLASKVFQIVSLLFVLLSVVGLCVESLPEFQFRQDPALSAIEVASIAFFTLELLVKLFGAPSKVQYLLDPMTLIDLVSILPYYIELMTANGSGGVLLIFRVVRLTRVFRVFKLSKYNQDIKLVFTTIARSKNAISLLVFLLAIALTIYSSLMYFVEQQGGFWHAPTRLWIRSDGSISPYQSIPHSMWWCIVTLTTVGYGDAVPETPAGKVVASLTMLTGVLVIAFPTMILGKNFNDVCSTFEKKKNDLAEARARITLRAEIDSAPKDSSAMPDSPRAAGARSLLRSKSFAASKGSVPVPSVMGTPSKPPVEAPPRIPPPSRRIACSYSYLGLRRYIHSVGNVFEYSPIVCIGKPAEREPASTSPPAHAFTVSVPLTLDDAGAHESAYQALRLMHKHVDRPLISVREVVFLSIEKTNLNVVAPYATLVTGPYLHHPSSVVPIFFRTETETELEDLRRVLKHLTVTVKLYYSAPIVTNASVTVPMYELRNTSMRFMIAKAAARNNGVAHYSEADMRRLLTSTVQQLPSVTSLLSREGGCAPMLGNTAAIANTFYEQFARLCPFMEVSGIPKHAVDPAMFDGDGPFCAVDVEVTDPGLFTTVDAISLSASFFDESNRTLVDLVRTLETKLEAHEGTRSM